MNTSAMTKKWARLAALSLLCTQLAYAVNDSSTSGDDTGSATTGTDTGTVSPTGATTGTGLNGSGVTPSGSGTTATSGAPASSSGVTGEVPLTEEVSGTVHSVNNETGNIQIRDTDGRLSEFKIDKEVSILRDEKRTSLPKVKAGDRVTLRPKTVVK